MSRKSNCSIPGNPYKLKSHAVDFAPAGVIAKGDKGGRRMKLSDGELGDVFGIDLSAPRKSVNIWQNARKIKPRKP